MSAMTCPRCEGDIEYEVERTSDGDGAWAQSGWVGFVHYIPLVLDESTGKLRVTDAREPGAPEHTHGMTACWCVWKTSEFADLDYRATERAAEGPTEP